MNPSDELLRGCLEFWEFFQGGREVVDGKRGSEHKQLALRRSCDLGLLNHALDNAIPLNWLSEDFRDNLLEQIGRARCGEGSSRTGRVNGNPWGGCAIQRLH